MRLLAPIFLLIVSSAYGQLTQPNRFEKEQKYSDEDYTVISLEAEGLALIREINKYKSGNRTWELLLLDTTLTLKKTIEAEIDNRNKLTGYDYSTGFVHLLFSRSDTKGTMELMSVNISTGEIDRYDINPELNLMLTQFSRVNDNFIFGGFVDRDAAVFLFDPAAKKLKIIPGFFQKDLELIDLRVNQNQTFNVLMIERGNQDDKKMIFKVFDSDGKQLLEDITPIDRDITLHTGIASTLESEDLVVLGTWGKFNSKQSSGFYFLPIQPFQTSSVKNSYFAQQEHYLDYLKPKRAAKIKAKTLEDLKNGNQPDFTSYAMPYKIVEHKGGYILLAESYLPSSNSGSVSPPGYNYPYYNSPYYNPYGSYYPSSRVYNPYIYGETVTNPEEIKVVESVVINFDKSGQIVWDHSKKFENVKVFSIGQRSDFYVDGDSLLIIYKYEAELKSKIINLDSQEFTEFTTSIRCMEGERVSSDSRQSGEIKFWFGNNFYVWGNQTIATRTKRETKTRNVFYINKVAVH